MSVLSNTGIRAGASAAGGDTTKYVEEVFSTFLYEGNDGTNTINNGIDLAGEGGLVWIKRRDGVTEHSLTDTERGAGKVLFSDQTWAEGTGEHAVDAFNNNGFSLDSDDGMNNGDGNDYVSWSFRKAPGFFDVVKYEGNGSGPRAIAHNLGCKPGCIIFKNRDSTVYYHWPVYHKSLSDPSDIGVWLNKNWDEENQNFFGDTDPTSTHFYVGNNDYTNADGENIIAYLFADGDDTDAQIFGDNEDEAIIKCGSYEGNGNAAGFFHSLGFEPQWLLLKDADSASDWIMVDDMRGWTMGTDQDGSSPIIHPHLSNAEQANAGKLSPRATGINIDGSSSWVNTDDKNFIYIAIRRGPMKTPEDATKVFAVDYGNASTNIPCWDSGFPVDLAFWTYHDREYAKQALSRLCGTKYLYMNDTDVEANDPDLTWDSNVGWGKTWPTTTISWMFRRAPGFCDVVAYTGNNTARTITHNLGVVPELMIVKCRSAEENWTVYHKDMTSAGYHLRLNSSMAEEANATMWNSTAPTASVFSVGANGQSNSNTESFIAYLFASCPGVSKIGTYTGAGSGTDVNIDCGFDAGARLVIIKGLGQGGHWFIYDTTRGIVAGNDPFCKMNSDQQCNAGDEDRVDPYTSGFTVSGSDQNHNTLNDTYIYLAIA